MTQAPDVPNWKHLWTKPVDELKAVAHMYEHEKSGAPLIYLACDDDNKVFCISFRTPPVDDTGIAHIMEHSVLCGSEKFPSKEPFVDLLKGSLQTFLNAFTADDRTMYPVASRNDKDFRNLMDVYLDAVFFPKLMTTPEILMQEGWHYQVDDESGDLNYNGVVYNEMKGVYSSPQSVLYRTIQRSMYPESTYANDSGGDPVAIPDLTQEMFQKFHDRYYHPSNSMVYLYGNGDIKTQLEFLDKEYLSRFEKIDFEAEVKPQSAFDKPKDVTAEYSIDPGDSEADKTFLSMNYLLPTDLADAERAFGMDLLSYILVGSEAAPLKRALLDAGVGLEIQSFYDSSILQPCFSIVVKGSNPDKKAVFLDVLDKTLRGLVENGIDRRLIEGAINRTEFSLREFQVSGFPKGLVLNMWMLEHWTYGGDPLQNLRYDPVIKSVRAKVDDGFFENLVRKHLLENTSRGFVMLRPKPGLDQENTEKTKTKLADVKKSLTVEELAEIKRQQVALIERQAAPDKPEDVAKIPTLEISDIDRKAEVIPFEEIGKDINVTVDTNQIVYLSLYFDSGFPFQNGLVRETSLLTDLLGRLDTENYTFAELSSEIDIHTGGLGVGLSSNSIKGETKNFASQVTAGTKVMRPQLEKGLDLALEVLTKTKFDDEARFKEIVQELRVGMEQSMIAAGHGFAQRRAASYFSPLAAFRESAGGIDYYRYLVELEKNFDEKIESEGKEITWGRLELQQLGALAKRLVHQDNAFLVVTLPKEEFEEAKPIFTAFQTKLPGTGLMSHFNVILSYEQKNEAVVIPSRVQYVVKSGDYRKAGFEYSGKMLVLQNILRTGYLWNNVRVQGGAYGGGVAIDRSGVLSLWSYRDPHLKRTVDIYEGVADYLEKLDMSEEELTKAIIATIGSLDKPMTPADKGGRIAARKLSGLTQEDVQRERDEVLSTTVEDLRKFAPMFRECMKQNNICVFGNEQKLDADKELFKNTIRPIE